LKRLLDEIIEGRVGRLVIAHKDRLLRFGAELVFAICEAKDVEVLIINQGVDTTFEEDLAQDVLEIITVFSARLYGSRSGKNQKLLDGVKQLVEAVLLPGQQCAGQARPAPGQCVAPVRQVPLAVFPKTTTFATHRRCPGLQTVTELLGRRRAQTAISAT
jgi:hypothetical protein